MVQLVHPLESAIFKNQRTRRVARLRPAARAASPLREFIVLKVVHGGEPCT